MNFSRNQPMSIGTGLIPFLEHNDANRALMGSNMQRQALPLLKRELPLIETGIETQICKSSQTTKLAEVSGIVTLVTNQQIIIKSILSLPRIKKNPCIQLKYKNLFKKIKGLNYKQIKYIVDQPKKSNQNTFIQQQPFIKNKEWVKKGQILTDGNATIQGKLALGKNLLIAYMSWQGYNFEDAVVINKRLVDENIFTSIQLKKQKIFITNEEKQELRIRD